METDMNRRRFLKLVGLAGGMVASMWNTDNQTYPYSAKGKS